MEEKYCSLWSLGPVDYRIPSVIFGARGFQHTYKNTVETGEFVVGIPSPELLIKFGKQVIKMKRYDNEFKGCGLTSIPSETVNHPE